MSAAFHGSTPAGNPEGNEHPIAAILQETLNQRRIKAIVALAWNGPQLWAFSCSLGFGVAPERVERMAGALALAAGAESCRVARIPGKVLIEIPKPPQLRKTLSPERMDALTPRNSASVAVGVATGGKAVWLDLSDPNACHVAIGGATGSGKSVLLHWILYRLARQNTPRAMRMLLLDPKGYELAPFAHLPHLVHPVTSDPREIARVLESVSLELDRRASTGQTNPRLFVVIDEVKDLITIDTRIATSMARIAQIGRALGITLIVSTQQPGGKSLGEALPNLPARLVGRISSATLTYGATGRAKTMADALLGKGDFLLLTAGGGITRLQVPLIGEEQFRKLPYVEKASLLDEESNLH
jgi:DNA segregation ATPase FtsK/SpoIIIE, S-DNA-T family